MGVTKGAVKGQPDDASALAAMAGFGIAGHKNNYSNGVRCGNWVEDKFGMDLATSGARNSDHFKTEAQAHFVAPKKMDDRQTRHAVEPAIDPAATRLGMPRHLLFGHGYEAHDPRAGVKEQFVTMAQTTSGPGARRTTQVLADHPDAETKRVLSTTRTERVRAQKKAVARESKVSGVCRVTHAALGCAGTELTTS